MENANANILHTTDILAARMIEGSLLLGEYFTKIEEARASTEGKGINLTKYTYAVGVECLNDVEAFKTYLDDNGVKLKGGYKPEKHFFAVIKAFATTAGIVAAGGEISASARSARTPTPTTSWSPISRHTSPRRVV